MSVEFKVPELGENVATGDVVSVLVKVGDTVTQGQSVLELETDKATVEVPAEEAGVVVAVHVSPGDQVKVGQVVLTLDSGAGESTGVAQDQAKPKAAVSPEAQAAPQPLPAAADAAIGTGTRPAPQPGIVAAPVKEPKASPGSVPAAKVPERTTRTPEPTRLVPASPAVRKFAREIGVAIGDVTGTGPNGRISIEDVKAYSRRTRISGSQPVRTSAAPLPDLGRFGPVEREKFNNVRRVTASRLAEAWANVVHVTNHDRADVTRLEELRERYAAKVEAAGGKLTVTAIAVKLAAAALKVFPKFNAAIDVASEEVVFRKYVNIGVAVDTPKGLLVPVIRNCDQKSIVEISAELKDAAERARQGKIAPDELQGGGFTITNLGGIGGTSFTPIVNFPEVAILGLSRTSVEPVFADGRFEPRKMLPLSLSYDHRLIDGADAARFLRWLVQGLEEPFFVLLD